MVILFSCGESSIVADYDTISVKNLIIKDDDGKKYKIKIKTDSLNQKQLYLEEVKE